MNVLLSIKPTYVNEILAGKKRFEFRKAIFKKKDISKIFIYSSSPVQKIVAFFEIARIIEDSPQELWEKCRKHAGIPEENFFEYFKNSDIGYAIEIKNLEKLSEPIDPYLLEKNFKPPQSYCYLSLDYFDGNKKRSKTSKEKVQNKLLLESCNGYAVDLDSKQILDKKKKSSKSIKKNVNDEFDNLPKGWTWTTLEESICVLTDGSHFSPKSIDKGYPYITVKDIKNDKIDFENCSKISNKDYNKLVKSGCKPQKGDILFSKDGTVGKVAIISFEKDFVVLSSLAIIRPFAKVNDSRFLFWVFKSNHFLNQALKSKKGVAIRRIILRDLKDLFVPLPPLPEQRAIVSKIEQLFSELDNGISNLKLAQEQLKVYRQAVLKKAFEGELTRKWRKQQVDLPRAEELLEHIRKEKEEVAKICGKKLKPVKTLMEDEIAELPGLPEGWGWVKIDDIVENSKNSVKAGPFGSSLKKEYYVPKGFKIYGQEQVISGDASYGDYYIPLEKYEELESCKVQPFDVLISLVGTIGKVLILPENCEAGVINPRLIKLSLNRDYYWPIFFKYYFESMFLKNLYKIKAHGATMDILTLGIIRELPFPFCSFPEQQAIVQEIETRLSVCDKLEQDIKENLVKAEALRQSILKRAFEGKLLSERELEEVRRAPDWKPAEKLLERVRAEKVQKGKGEKG